MSNNIKDILDYKSKKVEADKLKILEVLKRELLNFNFEEDYLKEGDLQIEDASEISFYSCVIENYTDTRSISESNRPNRSGVSLGSKRISEFNIWDYNLTFDTLFQNSKDDHDILESHHAIGCGTCKQQGKLRCTSCRGSGDITCNNCNGRGEKKCGKCNGKVDIKCGSCSGKGIKERGYGENKRTERCSSCSGLGSNKCTRCSNGFITCSTCYGSGKVTCYTCHGSGEVICYQCDGNRTMDHFFIVSASFINLTQTIYLTNPYPGFDQNKSKTTKFNTQNKLFDIQETRFKESHFNELKSSPFYRQITSFFDFTNNEHTKLITSRITCFENKYYEVKFNFYDEKYTLILDKNFYNSYYNGKKPSDQYELDLLKKTIDASINNDLRVTKITLQKLTKFNFISISENELIDAIDDTEQIYISFNEYKSSNYLSSENNLKKVSSLKKNEADYKLLYKKLSFIYFLNTTLIGSIGILAVFYTLLDKDRQYLLWNIYIAVGIIFSSWLVNLLIRNIHSARWLVAMLLIVQLAFLDFKDYNIKQNLKAIQVLEVTFKNFKKQHNSVLYEGDFRIFTKPTGRIKNQYYIDKNSKYGYLDKSINYYVYKFSDQRIYLDLSDGEYENWYNGNWYSIKCKNFEYETIYIQNNVIKVDTLIEIEYLNNNINDFKNSNFKTIFVLKNEYEQISLGLREFSKI